LQGESSWVGMGSRKKMAHRKPAKRTLWKAVPYVKGKSGAHVNLATKGGIRNGLVGSPVRCTCRTDTQEGGRGKVWEGASKKPPGGIKSGQKISQS